MSEPKVEPDIALMHLFALLHKMTHEEDFKKVWDNFIKEPFFDLLSIKRMCALFFLGGKASENKDIKIGELLK